CALHLQGSMEKVAVVLLFGEPADRQKDLSIRWSGEFQTQPGPGLLIEKKDGSRYAVVDGPHPALGHRLVVDESQNRFVADVGRNIGQSVGQPVGEHPQSASLVR